MADITIFEFDLTDAQFNAPFAGTADDESDSSTASADATEVVDSATGGGSPSLAPLAILVGLIVVAYLVRRWRNSDGTDLEITDVEVEPGSETESP